MDVERRGSHRRRRADRVRPLGPPGGRVPVRERSAPTGRAAAWSTRSAAARGRPLKLYCAHEYDSASWTRRDLSLEERARRHGVYERWVLDELAPFVRPTAARTRSPRRLLLRRATTPPTSASARRRLPARAGHERRLRRLGAGWRGSVATPSTSRTRPTTSPTSTAITSTGCAAACRSCSSLRPGPVGGHDRRARVDDELRRRCSVERGSAARSTCGATTCRTTGRRGDARSPIISRSPCLTLSSACCSAPRRTGRPPSRALVDGSVRSTAATRCRTERIVNEPFDLRYDAALRRSSSTGSPGGTTFRAPG